MQELGDQPCSLADRARAPFRLFRVAEAAVLAEQSHHESVPAVGLRGLSVQYCRLDERAEWDRFVDADAGKNATFMFRRNYVSSMRSTPADLPSLRPACRGPKTGLARY